MDFNRKRNLAILLLTMFFTFGYSQSGDKNVILTVSGQGLSLDKARQSALRTAVEQAFGAFISAKTEILNDEIVADQITSVSAGNIQSYETLSEMKLPNETWAVTLKAVVSVDKLTSFVQSKGVEVTVKGSLFSINIKQQLLNEQGETDAICEMVGVLHEPMQTSFDFQLINREPTSLDAESKNWSIPVEVSVIANDNYNTCMDYFKKTMAAISLSETEMYTYKELGKNIFSVEFSIKSPESNNKEILTYYLRRAKSMQALLSFLNNWNFYTSNFVINDGFGSFDVLNTKMIRNSEKEFFSAMDNSGYFRDYQKQKKYRLERSGWSGFKEFTGYTDLEKEYKINYSINIYNVGDVVVKYNFEDVKSIDEIEKLEKYKISGNGVRSEFKHGGYVVYEDSGHGLIASIMDINSFFDLPVDEMEEGRLLDSFYRINNEYLDSILKGYSLNAFNDWRIPNFGEFKKIFEKLVPFEISVFNVNTIAGGNYGFGYLLDSGSFYIQYYNRSFTREQMKIRNVNILKQDNLHIFSNTDDDRFVLAKSPYWYGIQSPGRDYGYLRLVRVF
ncbi:MAG: hypothetical protein RJA76_1051 [Bacteroidota bacterium]|jgi:hypothetical protein